MVPRKSGDTSILIDSKMIKASISVRIHKPYQIYIIKLSWKPSGHRGQSHMPSASQGPA